MYATQDFWNDRFKETDGFFDWYANWSEIKPIFSSHFPKETHSSSTFLMVGCGNSKMSEEMAAGGYPWVTNIDISPVVLTKMRQHHSSIKLASNEFAAMDATSMPLRSNSFDFCIDKGTFDALACGVPPDTLGALLQEMMRVCRICTILVTSGTPEKRMGYFEKYRDCERIEPVRIELSNLAQLINLLRTELKDKPLSAAM